jgi:hypothetical protein
VAFFSAVKSPFNPAPEKRRLRCIAIAKHNRRQKHRQPPENLNGQPLRSQRRNLTAYRATVAKAMGCIAVSQPR